MITLISTIFGVLSSLLPNVIKIFEKKLDYAHEIEITKIKMDAAREGLVLQLQVEGLKADLAEGESVRKHDIDIEYKGFWGTVRASIRPVITYSFFALFCGIKIAAFWVLVERNATPTELLTLVWDNETMGIFAAIMGFWFGSRAIEKFNTQYAGGSLLSLSTADGLTSVVSTTTGSKAAATLSKKAAKTANKRPAGTGREK
jgi:hypothetical protein